MSVFVEFMLILILSIFLKIERSKNFIKTKNLCNNRFIVNINLKAYYYLI